MGLNNQPGGDNLQFIFKNGDDLRQDILTLQLIGVMDKIWLDNDLDLKMTVYKTLGTDCEQGYLEFNENCYTLAYMQYHEGLFHTFAEDSIEVFIAKKLVEEYYGDKWPKGKNPMED